MFNLGSILFLPPVFLRPQLQIICCYIARYYVRKEHVRRGGGEKNICPLSWGGNTEYTLNLNLNIWLLFNKRILENQTNGWKMG